MARFTIYYDSIHEGTWFQALHQRLAKATLRPFPRRDHAKGDLEKILAYDRPDIVLADGDAPVLVIERTIEVPSGHNPGQRFARLAAAAQMRIPCVYFCPYAARKHGGKTQGPRYMNLRLFYAIKKMAAIEDAASTTINWPVDKNYEIIMRAEKDIRMKAFMDLYFANYRPGEVALLNQILSSSDFEREQEAERLAFIRSDVDKPARYDGPPPSVRILTTRDFMADYAVKGATFSLAETVVYKIGMTYVRSDPYAGMAMLYSYLYCGGMRTHTSHLVLHFPKISRDIWDKAAQNRSRKDVRLYLGVADGIIFGNTHVAIAPLRGHSPATATPLSLPGRR